MMHAWTDVPALHFKQVNPQEGALLDLIGAHILKPGVAGGLNHIDLSNIWWSCGMLGINPSGGRLLPALAREAIALAPDMNQQGVSNVLWGLSKQEPRHTDMYKMPGQPYPTMVDALLARSALVLEADGAPVRSCRYLHVNSMSVFCPLLQHDRLSHRSTTA